MFNVEIYTHDGECIETIYNVTKITHFKHCFRLTTEYGKEKFDKINVFGKGNPNDNYAKYFIGNSYLNPLVDPNNSPLFLANVTFEPGCRNSWHIHHAKKGGGQILICTAGEGWYQEEGKDPISLTQVQ